MKHPKIYLAGPIGGLSWDQATQWRNHVSKLLEPMDARSPMRDMDGRSLRGSCFTSDAGASQDPSLDKVPFQKLFERDYADVCEADAILFNFIGAPRHSYGTICELAWAFHMRKPRVVVIDAENVNNNPFGEPQYGHKTDNLADAVNYLRGHFGYSNYELAGGND